MGIHDSGNSKQIKESRRMIDLGAGIGIGAESLCGKKTLEMT